MNILETLIDLDARRRAEATAWAVVTVDPDTGAVVDVMGPYAEPEPAFIDAGRACNEWERCNPGEPTFRYDVVPLWEPTQ